MATRAAWLSPPHVEALNAITIEFYGANKKYVQVVEAWRVLLDHFNDTIQPPENLWVEKRQELFNDLLWKLATALNYDFKKRELLREIYSPSIHARIDNEQEIIRQGLTSLFKGEFALPLDIRSVPGEAEDFIQQKELRILLGKWLEGQSAVKIDLNSPS